MAASYIDFVIGWLTPQRSPISAVIGMHQDQVLAKRRGEGRGGGRGKKRVDTVSKDLGVLLCRYRTRHILERGSRLGGHDSLPLTLEPLPCTSVSTFPPARSQCAALFSTRPTTVQPSEEPGLLIKKRSTPRMSGPAKSMSSYQPRISARIQCWPLSSSLTSGADEIRDAPAAR